MRRRITHPRCSRPRSPAARWSRIISGPSAPIPPSWPVGDAYLRQSEAALPSVTYRDVFRDPRLQR